MIHHDDSSYASLGRALENARDDGILAPGDYAPLARALGAAIATGVIPLDAYEGIHRALAEVLEAAFARPAEVPASSGRREDLAPDVSLGAHLEVIGAVWDRVEPPQAEHRRAAKFFDDAFDCARATFAQNTFAAPLRVAAEEIPALLRGAGFLLHSLSGALPATPQGVATLADPDCERAGLRIEVGWGEQRFLLLLH